MNGIDKIAQRLTEQAQAEINGILGAAQEEAEQITARYGAQAQQEAAELAGKNEKAAAEREQRLISAAEMEAKKTVLAARQEMVEAVYVRALEKLCALPQEQYISVLADLLAQAAPNGRGEVIFSEEDRKSVGAAAVAKANAAGGGALTLCDETRPIRGGFILKDGNVEVNCAFDTLVRLQKAQTAGAVAKKLFD